MYHILDSTYKWYHMIFVLLFLTYLVWQSLSPSMLLQMALFHSFLWLSNIPLYISISISIYVFFIHLFVDGHLGCIHVLAIVNSAAMDIRMHTFSLLTRPFYRWCFILPISSHQEHVISITPFVLLRLISGSSLVLNDNYNNIIFRFWGFF